MTKEDYYRIRDEVYKNAGIDKFDFDLMMLRIITKAVEEEREACAKVCMDKWMEWMDASPDKRLDMRNDAEDCAFAIRERGAP